jgi:opacity protein-like surface antigen
MTASSPCVLQSGMGAIATVKLVKLGGELFSEKAFAKAISFHTLVGMRKMKKGALPPVCRIGNWKALLTGLVAITALSLSPVMAGTDMKSITPPACGNCSEKDWTLELGSGGQWSNVRSGQPNQAYTIVPIQFTASLKVDDVSLDNFLGGIFRGYTEFYFRGQFDQIVHGPENHYEGIMVGPRYNFVQPGWKIIPFVEGGVGLGFADSNPLQGGLGQDFNFSFEVAAGARYNITDDFFVRLACQYQHVSNAGLSEPQFANHPIDALGPVLSFGYSF